MYATHRRRVTTYRRERVAHRCGGQWRLTYSEQLFVHTRAVINEKTSAAGTLSGIRAIHMPQCACVRAAVRGRRLVQCGSSTSKFRLDTRRAEHRTRRDFPARWFWMPKKGSSLARARRTTPRDEPRGLFSMALAYAV